MTCRSVLKSGVLLATLLVAVPQKSAAAEITFGNTTDPIFNPLTQNRFPFGFSPAGGNYVAGGIYQQLYDSEPFGGMVSISQVAFASAAFLSPPSPALATFDVQLFLSTSPAPFNAPVNSFAANRGNDYQSVFNGSFTSFMKEDGTFDLVFGITPFLYNPAAGDLLLEVLVNQPTITGAPDLHFKFLGSAPDTSRVFQIPGTGVEVQKSGLVTRFTVTSVPEPDSAQTSTVGGIALLFLCLKVLSCGQEPRSGSEVPSRRGCRPHNGSSTGS